MPGTKAILIPWDRAEGRFDDHNLPGFVHPVRLHFKKVGGMQSPFKFAMLLLHLAEIWIRLGIKMISLRHQYDIVHVINAAPWFTLIAIPLSKILKKPVIVEMTLLGADDPLKLAKRDSRSRRQRLFHHRPLKYRLFLLADMYVSKSNALSDAYRRAGLLESKLFQIPSGVDTSKFKQVDLEAKHGLRDKLGLPIADIIILFVGGINKRKGLHNLLTAFRELTLLDSNVHLLILGPSAPYDKAYAHALHADVNEWQLPERVTFIDTFLSNVHEYMQAADIFALPSSREGLSVAILEAMSSGLPIAASDIPEISVSQIKHGEEGLLVPVGDITQLSKALTKLVHNAKLRSDLGQAARHRVLRDFDLDIVFEHYLTLYNHTLSRI